MGSSMQSEADAGREPQGGRELLIGIAQETVLLVAAAMLYQLWLIEFVRSGEYPFLGSGYFFLAELALFPVLNAATLKPTRLVGNVVGVLVYFLFLIPLAMLLGGA